VVESSPWKQCCWLQNNWSRELNFFTRWPISIGI